MSKKKSEYDNVLATDEHKRMFEETAKMIKAVRDGDEPCPMCQHNKSSDELSRVKVYRAPCLICGR